MENESTLYIINKFTNNITGKWKEELLLPPCTVKDSVSLGEVVKDSVSLGEIVKVFLSLGDIVKDSLSVGEVVKDSISLGNIALGDAVNLKGFVSNAAVGNYIWLC